MERVRRLLVDGYNVIGARPSGFPSAETDLDAARVRLVEDVAGFSAGRFRSTVVFDAAGNPDSDGKPHRVGNVSVVFSPAGATADTVIEALARRARTHGEEAVVVSSDAATQWAVMGAGVTRMSSAEFLREVAEDTAARPAGSGPTRTRLEDRLPKDVRERLGRWARGR